MLYSEKTTDNILITFNVKFKIIVINYYYCLFKFMFYLI